jgi:streptogramin lyase
MLHQKAWRVAPLVLALLVGSATILLPATFPVDAALLEFAIPSPNSQPQGITAGPDGNLWFTESATGKIGRITPSGIITEFLLPSGRPPLGITAGPDGNVWYSRQFGGVGQITPSGVVTEFPGGFEVGGIAAGPDGNLWLAYLTAMRRITPSGVATNFPLCLGCPTSTTPFAYGITAGPDGNLWFTEDSGLIGRISPAGSIDQFRVFSCCSPVGITAGPDGNTWFVQSTVGGIGRITPGGQASTSLTSCCPWGIAAGPDGALWFTKQNLDSIGRITTSGTVTEFALAAGSGPYGITAGPDGNVWFTESGGNRIGRVPASTNPLATNTPTQTPSPTATSTPTSTPTATRTPTPAPPTPPCAGALGVTVAADGTGRLGVTLTARSGVLTQVQAVPDAHVPTTNALIDESGRTGMPGDTFSATPGTAQHSFIMYPATAGQGATVPLVIVDSCGTAWSTLVGGGAGAYARGPATAPTAVPVTRLAGPPTPRATALATPTAIRR